MSESDAGRNGSLHTCREQGVIRLPREPSDTCSCARDVALWAKNVAEATYRVQVARVCRVNLNLPAHSTTMVVHVNPPHFTTLCCSTHDRRNRPASVSRARRQSQQRLCYFVQRQWENRRTGATCGRGTHATAIAPRVDAHVLPWGTPSAAGQSPGGRGSRPQECRTAPLNAALRTWTPLSTKPRAA